MTQLSLTDGIRLKAEGLDAIERTDEAWIDNMRETARKISLVTGCVSTDELREVVEKSGYQPKHPNSWGAILRGKEWMVVGRKRSEVPGNHGREIKVFKWVGDELP